MMFNCVISVVTFLIPVKERVSYCQVKCMSRRLYTTMVVSCLARWLKNRYSLKDLPPCEKCCLLKNLMQNFYLSLTIWSCGQGVVGLVVRALNSQSSNPWFKTTRWLQGRLSLSFFRGRSNEYQDLPETQSRGKK